jgi:hypothetical protein
MREWTSVGPGAQFAPIELGGAAMPPGADSDLFGGKICSSGDSDRLHLRNTARLLDPTHWRAMVSGFDYVLFWFCAR